MTKPLKTNRRHDLRRATAPAEPCTASASPRRSSCSGPSPSAVTSASGCRSQSSALSSAGDSALRWTASPERTSDIRFWRVKRNTRVMFGEIPQNRQHRHAGGDGLTMGVSWVRPQTSSSSLRQWWEQVSASHTGLSVGVKSAVRYAQDTRSPGPSAELIPTSYLFWSSAAFLIHIIFSFFSMVLHVASMAFCAFGRSLYKTLRHIKSGLRPDGLYS